MKNSLANQKPQCTLELKKDFLQVRSDIDSEKQNNAMLNLYTENIPEQSFAQQMTQPPYFWGHVLLFVNCATLSETFFIVLPPNTISPP
tara:strand:+ start:936 stop:1202 length:267 start_codon:yes stop_codon:yes gene_type:complete